MHEVRCGNCKKLLYKIGKNQSTNESRKETGAEYTLEHKGEVECKCPRCGLMNINHVEIFKKLNTNKVKESVEDEESNNKRSQGI